MYLIVSHAYAHAIYICPFPIPFSHLSIFLSPTSYNGTTIAVGPTGTVTFAVGSTGSVIFPVGNTGNVTLPVGSVIFAVGSTGMLITDETSGAGVTTGGGPPKSQGCRPVRGVGWKRSLHWRGVSMWEVMGGLRGR